MLLNQDRSKKLEIGLSIIKMEFDKLAEVLRLYNRWAGSVSAPGIRDCWCRDGELTLDQLDAIANCVPLDEELEAVRGYEGDVSKLGKAERFVLEVGSIDGLSTMLQV